MNNAADREKGGIIVYGTLNIIQFIFDILNGRH